MNAWLKKNLGDAVMAAPELETLKEKFAATFKQPNFNSAAIFVHYDSTNHLHCNVTVFFSPGAIDLALSVNAEVCKKPFSAGLFLLCGSAEILARP